MGVENWAEQEITPIKNDYGEVSDRDGSPGGAEVIPDSRHKGDGIIVGQPAAIMPHRRPKGGGIFGRPAEVIPPRRVTKSPPAEVLSERKFLAGEITRRAEAVAGELRKLGTDVKPWAVYHIPRKEYDQMVKERPFFYWDLARAKDIPRHIDAYRSLAAQYPQRDNDGVPLPARTAVEQIGKAYLISHGVPSEISTIVVNAVSYIVFGPKSTTEKVVDLGISKLVQSHY